VRKVSDISSAVFKLSIFSLRFLSVPPVGGGVTVRKLPEGGAVRVWNEAKRCADIVMYHQRTVIHQRGGGQ